MMKSAPASAIVVASPPSYIIYYTTLVSFMQQFKQKYYKSFKKAIDSGINLWYNKSALKETKEGGINKHEK
jgi:hypothetical protein